MYIYSIWTLSGKDFYLFIFLIKKLICNLRGQVYRATSCKQIPPVLSSVIFILVRIVLLKVNLMIENVASLKSVALQLDPLPSGLIKINK